MVDPNVYGFVGIDSEKYSGFAFGIGVERIAALKYNVPDLRMLLDGDMRFTPIPNAKPEYFSGSMPTKP